MKRTKIFNYFAFGYNYNILHSQEEGQLIHGKANSLLSSLDEFFNYVKELDLQVTNKAAGKLLLIQQRLTELPKDTKVSRELAQEIREATDDFDKTLDAELQLRYAYIVTPKRTALNNLLDTPEKLLHQGVFNALPLITRFDFSRACLCIAFDLPTAAVFHLMRGTEGALRFYYITRVKRNRVNNLMWGPIIDHLRKRRDRPEKALIDHLDNIRTNFRNPTQHPDAFYSLDEAQDLLSLSADVISRMVKDLIDRKLIK